MLQQEMARLERCEELGKLDAAAKARADADAWRGWLRRYTARLQQEADAGANPQRRIATMNGINPRSDRMLCTWRCDYLSDDLSVLLVPMWCHLAGDSMSMQSPLHVVHLRSPVCYISSLRKEEDPHPSFVIVPNCLCRAWECHMSAKGAGSVQMHQCWRGDTAHGDECSQGRSADEAGARRYVLRNWIAQRAIDAAEKGDYSEVRRVLRLLENPYSDDAAADLDASSGSGSEAACGRELQYDGPVPQWAKGLCVSCSS